ncbi:hypothetical protein BDZ90DRAFT_258460 [Jaminaea rosea]|uniref:Non-classical export protein 1 n=1 Tax=Jaminaea rosea TaxID=1569628 RepID=A0A316V294_9BASI|nr:hypothetical protein BDZ90DRAFT_258460 [Jaminaea rosea]PWN29545.1 hypothetical protein BDZ90DRAFT_258460 [Jaminaea rosea]
MPRYLVGRISDPLLGISTGVLAYILWENDGRNAAHRPEGRMLSDLVKRRWSGEAPPPAPAALRAASAAANSGSTPGAAQTRMV